MDRDVEKCKYFNYENLRKNGRGCMRDANCPARCYEWEYPFEKCNYYKKKLDAESET